jgi:hypothetical protein
MTKKKIYWMAWVDLVKKNKKHTDEILVNYGRKKISYNEARRLAKFRAERLYGKHGYSVKLKQVI